MRYIIPTPHQNSYGLQHPKNYLGGLEKFDEGGILTRKVYMIQIQNGRFVQLN